MLWVSALQLKIYEFKNKLFEVQEFHFEVEKRLIWLNNGSIRF